MPSWPRERPPSTIDCLIWHHHRVDLASLLSGVLGGTAIGAVLTYVVSVRSLSLQRRVETIGIFRQVTTAAHGFRDGSEWGVGVGEQLAAIYLVADLGRRDEWLSISALAFLQDLKTWSAELPPPEPDGTTDMMKVQVRARVNRAAEQAHGMLVQAMASRPLSWGERWAGLWQVLRGRRLRPPKGD